MMNVDWDHQSHSTPQHVGSGSVRIADDPRFPQIGTFHDEQVARAHLRIALGLPDRELRCAIVNVWYVFARSFQVVYRVQSPAETTLTPEITLLVRFFGKGESHAAYREAREQIADAGALLHLADWDAIAWRFPADPQLPQLPALLDAEYIARRLSPRGGELLNPALMSWKLLSYLPGERSAIMYQFASSEHMFIGKIQLGDLAVQQHQRMQQLWSSPGRQFRMAEPLEVDPTTGIRWERFITGQRIEEQFGAIDLGLISRQALSGLVNLHSLPIAQLPAHGPQQILSKIGRKTNKRIRDMMPPLAPNSMSLLHSLEHHAGSLAGRPLSTIHGDFHTANMLVCSDGIAMLDLDNLAYGDAAYDIALFGSRMLLLALYRGERLHEIAHLVASLPEQYEAVGGTAIPEAVYAWYLAAALIGRQIKTCIRHYAPELGRLTPALLHYAAETIERQRFEAKIVYGYAPQTKGIV